MIDFQEVKAKFTFAAVIAKLDLKLATVTDAAGVVIQWRGACPVCDSKGSLVVTEAKGYFCFSAKKGGDQIALVAHIKNIQVKEAAEWIAKTTTESNPSAAEPDGMTPLAYLDPAHEAVAAVGLGEAFAKKIGAGYAGRGILKGSVAIPIRDETGKLLGYIGAQEPLLLPKDFQ